MAIYIKDQWPVLDKYFPIATLYATTLGEIMKSVSRKRITTIILASLLSLTLVVTAPLTGFAGSGIALAKDLQQNRIVSHALGHQNETFKEIEDRNKGIKITTGYAWCAWFIEHCSNRCGLGSIIPSNSAADFAVGNLATDLVNKKGAKITFVNETVWNKRKGNFKKSRRSYDKKYQPRKGDIVLYANYQISGSYWFSHVGFVYEDCDKALSGVKTVEGNTMASNEKNWDRTSIVGVRPNADDSNKERRIAAYITPKYCQHKSVDKKTGLCKNSKCKADYFRFDNVDTSCATDEAAGVTYTVVTDPQSDELVAVRKYPGNQGAIMIEYNVDTPINVIGTVKSGNWYKVGYVNASGTTKYGYIDKKWIKLNDNNSNNSDNLITTY